MSHDANFYVASWNQKFVFKHLFISTGAYYIKILISVLTVQTGSAQLCVPIRHTPCWDCINNSSSGLHILASCSTRGCRNASCWHMVAQQKKVLLRQDMGVGRWGNKANEVELFEIPNERKTQPGGGHSLVLQLLDRVWQFRIICINLRYCWKQVSEVESFCFVWSFVSLTCFFHAGCAEAFCTIFPVLAGEPKENALVAWLNCVLCYH